MAALTAHLWESSLFALAVACVTLVFRNNGAHVRYWLWFAASLKFLIPFSVLAAIGRQIAPKMMAVSVTTPESVAFVIRTLSAPAVVPAVVNFPSHNAGMIDLTWVLAALWVSGFVAVLASWTMRWLRIRNALRAATPVALDVPIPVRMTATHIEPGLVGIIRPMLLLPKGMTTHLTGQELRAVLAHELCHLRRRDNLTAAIHMLAQAVFWFHPMLWWIGTMLVAERERACDEAVATSGSTPEVYAEGILKVCKLHVRSPLMCASGILGANLKQRIKRIVDNNRTQELGGMKSAFIITAVVTTFASPVLLGWASAHGQTIQSAISIAPASKPSYNNLPTASLDVAMTDPEEQVPRLKPHTVALRLPATGRSTSAEPASRPALSLQTTSAANGVVQPRLDPVAGYPFFNALPHDILEPEEFGITILAVTVEPNRLVSKIVVAKSSGNARLDEAFQRAFKCAAFLAGTVNGSPQTMTVTVKMEATDVSVDFYMGAHDETWLYATRWALATGNLPLPPSTRTPVEPAPSSTVATAEAANDR